MWSIPVSILLRNLLSLLVSGVEPSVIMEYPSKDKARFMFGAEVMSPVPSPLKKV